ncbi:MAG: hypothetical protein ACRD1E_11790, partial [Terriglobales bacterium]
TEATLRVEDAASHALVRSLRVPIHAGFNQAEWDLRYAPAGTAPAGGRGGASGPWTAPGEYTVSIEVAGQPPLTTALTVAPDPEDPLTPAQQRQRQAQVMDAYRLQLALEPARLAAAAAAKRIAALQAYFTAMAQPAESLAAVANASRGLAPVNASLNRALALAAAAARAMDASEDLPTAAQRRQLAWAHQDAAASVAELNRFLAHELAAAVALGGHARWPAIAPVPIPGSE